MQAARQRILCIDNRASRNLVVYLLGLSGYQVVETSSIAEAVTLSGEGHFDLHLLNHELVAGNEVDSCERLHESAPRTPILFYSTVLYPYRQIRAIHCRLHDHRLEPVNVCAVVEYVSRMMKGQTSSVCGEDASDSQIARRRLSVEPGASAAVGSKRQ